MTHEQQIKELTMIPGVGKSIANNLWNIGIKTVADLRGKQPEKLYQKLEKHEGMPQDRCVLYVFRCAVYFAETENETRDPEKLKWWNWKDKK
ncbi:MAG TPA: helix-hairpin-helix domain-containing protein [Bacteroidota bacterium]|nr:helix-hairpin-helix domain-containing protein [Bacteroidota bacterium]